MKAIKITFILLSLLAFISCGKVDKADKNKNSETIAEKTHIMVKLPTVQCNMCKNTIENGLKKIDGIVSVNVDVEKLMGHVDYDPEVINPDDIEKAISSLGYQANDTEADSEVYSNLPNCCKLPKDR